MANDASVSINSSQLGRTGLVSSGSVLVTSANTAETLGGDCLVNSVAGDRHGAIRVWSYADTADRRKLWIAL
ncbi:MAG: hypothetical protein JWM55_1880 [Acidimicrobiaceae bacterium]|nr:hypothetical protein [Acidimicrobiaceae bacterium]